MNARKLVFEANIKSRLLYNSQTWILSSAQLDKIDAVYLRMLRSLVRNGHSRHPETFKYRLSNKRILRITKCNYASEHIKLLQRRFVAHIVRMSNRTYIKQMMFNDNQNKKKGHKVRNILDQVLLHQNMSKYDFFKNAINRKF